MEQRFSFDEVAAEYAAARPAYPALLFDDLARHAGLRAGSRVLELGCGPGTATVGLLGRGLQLVCLEPGPRLAAHARARAAGTATTVVEQTFEDYALPTEPFDLVFAAQSFHWIDHGMRFHKAAAALRAGGMLALFAHCWLRSSDGLRERFDACYAEHAPSLELGADQRARLLAAIGRAIDDAGGVIVVDDEVGFCCGTRKR